MGVGYFGRVKFILRERNKVEVSDVYCNGSVVYDIGDKI